MKLTNSIAYAIGKDTGNRNMKNGNRTKWNEADWNMASKITNELLDKIEKEK